MRSFHLLIALTLALAGASGLVYWRTYQPELDGAGVAAEAARIRAEFAARVQPAFEIPIARLKQERAGPELSDPRLALPRPDEFAIEELAPLVRYADTCEWHASLRPRDPALKKAFAWHHWVCDGNAALPADFFERSPLLHPSGKSYAKLAQSSGRAPYNTPEWTAAHASQLHLLETLREGGVAAAAIDLGPRELQALLSGDDLVLSTGHALLADRTPDRARTAFRYRAYPREAWERFVSRQPLVTHDRVDRAECAPRESTACWVRNPDRQASRTRLALAGLLSAFVAMSVTLTIEGFRRRKARRQESEQRLFTLQMLTHELRTPATAMRLSIEAMRSEYDALPPGSQREFLRLCGELQRLDRVVEASRDYLDSQARAPLGALSSAQPLSINELVESVLELYAGRVTVRYLDPDEALPLDRYWTTLCIKNLVDNALAHGTPPVEITLAREEGAIVLSVIDQGSVAFATLGEMSEPFRKRRSSTGLGLGLAIVQKVAHSMGGRLEFKTSPTTFSIHLRTTQ